jgi:hypothetical protein
VLFNPLDPDPGSISGMNNFLRLLPETLISMKKGSFYFSSLFLCRIWDPGWKMFGSGSGMKNVQIRIEKLLGSATLCRKIQLTDTGKKANKLGSFTWWNRLNWHWRDPAPGDYALQIAKKLCGNLRLFWSFLRIILIADNVT